MLRHYKGIDGGEMFVAKNDGQEKSGPRASGPPGAFGLLSRRGLVDGDVDGGRAIGRCRRRRDRKRGCAG